MVIRRVRLLAALLAVSLLAPSISAQLRVQPVGEHEGEVALRLVLRKLGSVGTFMQTTAHPDDEDNGLLAMLGHGRGMRSVLLSATRGEGGQNEIGPELFQALSILRTEELLAAHRFDGAEQYFTRAVDFGYSFSVEESFDKWGRDEIVGDFVRHIRTVRPDVIAGFLCDGTGGGQHHQASTELTREAYRAAADPSKYPEQIESGLRPWQARRLFCTDLASFSPRSGSGAGQPLTRVRDTFEPLFGRMYGELGIEARSMHKCQGTSQLLPLPGSRVSRIYRLLDAAGGRPAQPLADLFDGMDTSLESLAAFGTPALSGALRSIAATVTEATRAVGAAGPHAAAAPLAKGLALVRELRSRLGSLVSDEAGRFEIDFRLEQKERQFETALMLAHGVRLEVLADDGLVIAGQPIKVSALGRVSGPETITVAALTFTGLEGSATACRQPVEGGGSFSCEAPLRVGNARLSTPYWRRRTDAARYDFDAGVPFGVPFSPTPFRAGLTLTLSGQTFEVERPVEFRYDNIVAGEKRMELQVVPALAVTIAPDIVVIPADAAAGATADPSAAAREVEVTVTNHERGATAGTVSLRAPAGWTVAPQQAGVRFSREDESATIRFRITPAGAARAGSYTLAASVERTGQATRFTDGYEVIEYAHVRRRHLVKPAETGVQVIDVTIASGLKVGYIMGVGDQVPPAIQQLGASLSFIGPDELASGNLSVYDVIMTGVRAYERRPDLRANNHRLLEYAEGGGTVLVQYNKFEFNQAQYGPFPAKVGSDRVTDEGAQVTPLVPEHPVFNRPNRIGGDAWQGWVQERGLYFLGDRDPRYQDLVALEEPFEHNRGRKTGALVEARVGKGRWIYVGLGLWRQLPAGTPGAYRLLANLLSLGRAQ